MAGRERKYKMKIAACQMNIIWEDKEKNLEKCKNFIHEAKNNGADVIFFPEMSLTGFSMQVDKTIDHEGKTLQEIKKLASEYKIAVGIGWVGKNKDKAENHYSIISHEGACILDYIKIHPFSYAEEDKYFEAGNKLEFCQLNEFNIVAAICYDLRFPEIFQAASMAAEIIIVPANWPAARSKHWEALLMARAIENQAYIVGVNCVGDMGKQDYVGKSQIISPGGDILTDICDAEKILYADVENDISSYRTEFPVKNDRRQELYKELKVKKYECNR